MRRFWPLLIILTMSGCDRRPGSPQPVPASTPTHTVLEVRPISQLPPNRIAHVAADSLNNVLYTYETEEGRDGAIVAGADSVPRATHLTSANILAAMGETVGGNGTIQDMATGPDGAVYFLFIGGKGRVLRACIGQFTLRNEKIRIIFDTAALSRTSGMGLSLDLARGVLLPTESRMYLFLRHSDSWAMLGFSIRPGAMGGDITLNRMFDTVRVIDASDSKAAELDLTSRRYDLAPGPENNLLVLDHNDGTVFQVADTGRAQMKMRFAGLPSDLSMPLVAPQPPERLFVFAAVSDPIATNLNDVLNPRLPKTSYPALLEFRENQIIAIGREDLRVPNNFPAYALRFTKLVWAPDGSMLGYDSSSGQLMRLRWGTERQ